MGLRVVGLVVAGDGDLVFGRAVGGRGDGQGAELLLDLVVGLLGGAAPLDGVGVVHGAGDVRADLAGDGEGRGLAGDEALHLAGGGELPAVVLAGGRLGGDLHGRRGDLGSALFNLTVLKVVHPSYIIVVLVYDRDSCQIDRSCSFAHIHQAFAINRLNVGTDKTVLGLNTIYVDVQKAFRRGRIPIAIGKNVVGVVNALLGGRGDDELLLPPGLNLKIAHSSLG